MAQTGILTSSWGHGGVMRKQPTRRLREDELENPTLKGSVYRATHKAAVIGVLGDRAPQVSSRGSHFYNVDRWTIRVFVSKMCEWAKGNPECIPTRSNIKEWVQEANASRVAMREIVIANTPSKLKLRTALALTGGAYHEAFHTYYSCTRDIRVDEMCGMVLPRWARVPDWSKYYNMLQTWNNIIEDIRIERLGRVDFPGSYTKLHDLQDFILKQEATSIGSARSHDQKAGRGALSVIMATFRDIGLGYNTDIQQEALARYRAEAPDAMSFVLGKGKGNPGPLTNLLKEAIALPQDDDIGCVRVAMDVIGVLFDNSSEQDKANDQDNQEHQPGEGEKLVCPGCQAPGSKLVIRPKSNGRGGKVKGVGILTCSLCGYQEEVKLQPPQAGQASKPDPENTPRFEGFDTSPDSSGDPKGDDAKGDDAKGDDPKGDDAKGDDAKGDDPKGDDPKGDDPKGDDPKGDDAKGDDAKGDDAKGDDAKGDDPLDEGGSVGQVAQNESNTDASKPTPNAPGGGHNYEAPQIAGNDWSDLVDNALADAHDTKGLKDNNSALESAVSDETRSEDHHDGGVQKGECAWRPYDPSQDEFIKVVPSVQGKDHDRALADRLYASVKDEASFLRARLRNIVRALEMTHVVHGTRRGRRLSTRFLVDSRNTLAAGESPKRAYKQIDAQIDTSMAAALIIDESGSMSGHLKDATRVLCAITEPLDSLGCPVQVSGFRDGGRYRHPDHKDGGCYHRYNAIVHDIFKTFDEPLRAVKYRFANTRATGGTPMADGVQYGLEALSRRSEGHRILFVITDGMPNSGHASIIKRQTRLAKRAGIHIIGVGLGHDAKAIQNVFQDSIWTEQISDMPKALIAKLNDLVDVRASGRGKRMGDTG